MSEIQVSAAWRGSLICDVSIFVSIWNNAGAWGVLYQVYDFRMHQDHERGTKDCQAAGTIAGVLYLSSKSSLDDGDFPWVLTRF